MWKWQGERRGKLPLPGVPGRDLTDEEFEHYAAKYDARFEPGALAASGLYVQSRGRTVDANRDATASAAEDGEDAG